MGIELLGFPTTLGLPRQARQHGPEVLRAAGLEERLERSGWSVRDLGNLPLPEGVVTDPAPVRVQKVVDVARIQAEHWLHVHTPGELMLTVGGDHTTALGTLWALSLLGRPCDVIWIDAHGDFNLVGTSPSGNPHGMVLALACGLMPQFMPRITMPSSLHLWGIRDLDAEEALLLRHEQIAVLSPDAVRADLARLIDRLGPDVYISFDVDSVEPVDAPGTMTPVPGGFRGAEALDLIGRIARERRIVAMDVVEFHPDYDRDGITAALAVAAIAMAMDGAARESRCTAVRSAR